jgi:hypothetical protein
MSSDPIVEEVRKYRDEYAKKFNYDLQAIYLDLKEQQLRSGRKVVSLAPKLVKPAVSPENG